MAIVLTITACAFFCLLDTGSKYVGAALPLLMALWLRYVLQSLFTVGYGVYRHGGDVFRTQHLRFQIWRAALFCASNACAMMSLRYLPLAEFTAIVAMTPIAMTLVAALWLRQPVSPLRWVLVAVGFVGTMAIIRPGGASFSGGALIWPLLQLAANTTYQIVSSQMAGKERPLTTQIYTSLLALTLTTATLPWMWQWPGSAAVWLGALAMGVGELLGDKMKSAPDRTVFLGLLARVMSAGIAGAALAPRGQEKAGAAAAVGTAIPLAYATLAGRKRAMSAIGQTRSGLIEDALVAAACAGIVALAVRSAR